MPLAPETIDEAARFKIPAVERVLSFYRPAVHRLAVGLTGRDKAGAAVARRVLARSLDFARSWDDPSKVERWFYHQTILIARPYCANPPDTRKDALLPAGGKADPRSLAFVKALRSLPSQQREAWLLTQGEKLAPRPVATAMDCSVEASANHLLAAKRTLTDIAGDDYPALEARVLAAYAALTPTGDETLPLIRSTISRWIWPRRIKRITITIIILSLLAALAWTIWKYYPHVNL
jgi:DNA-directed RNA polymerase specialized sigma24 family protein